MIKRLAEDVSTRIAAGEVIERPGSVAKELIENSIDAGSHTITIYTEQGGKSSFVIEDDGCGISFDELPLAIERYATSKISDIDDLDNISTLGYRGEALASVAAVSRMEIRSIEHNCDEGGLLRCEAGNIVMHTKMPVKHGTRIQIDDLFFNLPARRKFLKTSSGELRKIIRIVNDYALVHPEITFRLYETNKKILEYNSVSTINDAVFRKFGKDALVYSDKLQLGSYGVFMWWNPLPDSRRTVVTIFVNGRCVQDVSIKAAIMNADNVAYGEWIVMLTIPTNEVDVNIHPTKEEVRFRKSSDVFKIVNLCTKKICTKRNNISHTIDTGNNNINQFSVLPVNSSSNDQTASTGWELYKKSRVAASNNNNLSLDDFVFTDGIDRAEKEERYSGTENRKFYIGENKNGFLIFDFPNGIAIMDPHAVHERILFEEICENFKDRIDKQWLMMPLEIPHGIAAEANLHSEELSALGFTIEKNMLLTIPGLKGKGHIAPVDMLRSALRGIEVENDPTKRDREVWWRMTRIACKNAIKLGHKFEKKEAEELLQKLEKCETPYTCPHGRPTIFLIDNKKLFEMFER